MYLSQVQKVQRYNKSPHKTRQVADVGQVESKHPEQGGTYSTRQASLNPFRLSRSNTDPQMSFQNGNYLIHSLHPRRLSLPNKDVRYAWYEWVLLLISSLWRSLLQYLTRTAQSSMPYLHGEPGATHDGRRRQRIGCTHRDPAPSKDEKTSRAWTRMGSEKESQRSRSSERKATGTRKFHDSEQVAEVYPMNLETYR